MTIMTMTINSRNKGADRLEGGFIIPLDQHGLSEAAKHYRLKGTDFEPMPTDDEIGLSKKVRNSDQQARFVDEYDPMDNG